MLRHEVNQLRVWFFFLEQKIFPLNCLPEVSSLQSNVCFSQGLRFDYVNT